MPSSREKGKIAHSEWDAILSRHLNGESLASIARSYGCTPPAIRYIVGRRLKAGRPARSGTSEEAAPLHASADVRRLPTRPVDRPPARPAPGAGQVFSKEFRTRVVGDIAAFVDALEALCEGDTPQNREALVEATDRLLRAAARTRIELERTQSPAAQAR